MGVEPSKLLNVEQQAQASLTGDSVNLLRAGQKVASLLLNMNPRKAARELAAKTKIYIKSSMLKGRRGRSPVPLHSGGP